MKFSLLELERSSEKLILSLKVSETRLNSATVTAERFSGVDLLSLFLPLPLLSYEAARVCRCMGRGNFILLQNVALLTAEEYHNLYWRLS